MQEKIRKKFYRPLVRKPRKIHIKVRYLIIALVFCGAVMPRVSIRAENCPDVKIIFARGSGEKQWEDRSYLEFKNTIEQKLKTTDLTYEFVDLDYPAVGVGIEKLGVAIGAFFSAGEGHEFGESVKIGIKNLKSTVNDASCKNTKYVLGGYSQGAMLISKTLDDLDADKIIYAATFGDPKIYLPEGKGLIPDACKGLNLSDYRMYVPDCQAYKGLLGAYIPYESEAFVGKVGTWCNKRDIFCSSHFNVDDHLGYVSESLYEDASRVIFDKITKNFGIENHISSPHDTAILIDSTGSMYDMIENYKSEALRLAKETLDSGGRVALYDYRDLGDPYSPVEHCNFDTCTIEVFENELAKISADGGGDTPESLLSASFHVMKALKWKYGSTKSLVVLTDANFLSPDRDGMTFDEVVQLSKTIDPVNFYVITTSYYSDYYVDLVEQTGGKLVTDFDELSLLTDFIIDRYDSLPKVEEATDTPERPVLKVKEIESTSDGARIKFDTNGKQTLVIFNDALLGITEKNEITINELIKNKENKLLLVPLGDDIRGDGVEVDLSAYGLEGVVVLENVIIPKAPDTGRR